jgi:hydroxylaminobenzene mutase
VLIATVSWLVKAGAVELAIGALAGWLVWAAFDFEWPRTKLKIKAPHQLLRGHIDYVLMGLILIAAGLSAPDFPQFWAVVLAFGAYMNATLLFALGWIGPRPKELWAQTGQLIGFIPMSAGAVALAVYLLTS